MQKARYCTKFIWLLSIWILLCGHIVQITAISSSHNHALFTIKACYIYHGMQFFLHAQQHTAVMNLGSFIIGVLRGVLVMMLRDQITMTTTSGE